MRLYLPLTRWTAGRSQNPWLCRGIQFWCPAVVCRCGLRYRLQWCSPGVVSCCGVSHDLPSCSPVFVSRRSIASSCPVVVSHRCVPLVSRRPVRGLPSSWSWSPIDVSRRGLPSSCPIVVSRRGLPSWSPVVVSRRRVSSSCPVVVSRRGLPSWSPVVVSRRRLPSWSPVVVSRRRVPSWSLIVVSRVMSCHVLPCWLRMFSRVKGAPTGMSVIFRIVPVAAIFARSRTVPYGLWAHGWRLRADADRLQFQEAANQHAAQCVRTDASAIQYCSTGDRRRVTEAKCALWSRRSPFASPGPRARPQRNGAQRCATTAKCWTSSTLCAATVTKSE